MKYAIIIPDGCADEPQESLGGKFPLEAARVPNMDAIASAGVVGRANNVPPNLPAGSDVANLSLLGYDPLAHFTGRAPLEAAAQGIELGADDWAIRCNLVTVADQTMRDFTAGHITTEEAKQLLAAAQETLGNDRLQFFPGVSYRNLLVYRGAGQKAPFSVDTRATPPHDLTDKSVLDDYPRGPGSDLLNQLMSDSMAVFAEHPVNRARVAQGKLPATNIWLWGQGRVPKLKSFADVYGRRGVMITAVDLLRGVAGGSSAGGGSKCREPPAIPTPITRPKGARPSRRCPTPTWCASTSKPRTKPRTREIARRRSKLWKRSTRRSSVPCTRL